MESMNYTFDALKSLQFRQPILDGRCAKGVPNGSQQLTTVINLGTYSSPR